MPSLCLPYCHRFLTALVLLTSLLPAVRAGTDTASPSPDIHHIVRAIDPANIELTIRKLVSFGTRNTLSTQDDPQHGIGAARDWLAGQFRALQPASGGRLKVELQSFEQPVAPRIPHPVRLTNIVATLPGDNPDAAKRILIVSGHYDSICTNPTNAVDDAPGANDDASGVAAVLEMARVMSPYHFHATIVFVCVAGEEQGLLGSTYFAEQAKTQNWQIEGMFTNDIIGGTLGGNGIHDDHTVRVFSEGIPSNETTAEANQRRSVGGESDGPSRQLARFIKETGERYVHGMKVTLVARRDRYLRGGDHIPFNERGFSAVRFTEPNEDYHHQHQNVRTENGVAYGDLPEFVDFPYVAQVARVNAASLAILALAPAPPRNAGLVTRRLTNDTDLRWDANTEPDLAGYEIVWRATTEPNWSHARLVGNATTYTVKGLSKDDYLFGIRAVDKQGRRSPVSYPRPSR
ncbi:MAG TPA: M28 family metallopeptidase [Chthonomonadaceae bacterium]|nr:M28 family metallopeptidase [Chthonomonadaceae bacterium]